MICLCDAGELCCVTVMMGIIVLLPSKRTCCAVQRRLHPVRHHPHVSTLLHAIVESALNGVCTAQAFERIKQLHVHAAAEMPPRC